MREFVVGAVMLVSLFGVACGSAGNHQGSSSQESSDTEENAVSEDTKAENTQQQSKSKASSQQNLSLGDTATFAYGDTVTVYSYTSPAQPTNNIWTPAPGTRYAAIDVEGCAGEGEVTDAGDTQMTFNPFYFTLQMPDNTRLQPTVGVVEPALNEASLPPGDCLRGSVSFEVPQGRTPSYVIFTKPTQENAKWAITTTEVEDVGEGEAAVLPASTPPPQPINLPPGPEVPLTPDPDPAPEPTPEPASGQTECRFYNQSEFANATPEQREFIRQCDRVLHPSLQSP